ncbi:hypothetical protein [Dactylosporangium salmoneum]|uniref:Uncharacterized protein n=1 Tax=Dactylosporangium salmoneum TaxID=53361 RepID=A0ABP5SUE2_9ACTN
MTVPAVPAMVAAISVTMQCAIPIGDPPPAGGQVPDERDLAWAVADAIGDGRVAAALRAVLPGASAAVSVRVTAGHVTLALASDLVGVRQSPAGADCVVPSTVLVLPISRTDPSYAWLMAAHQPRRPGWCCATCGTPWPCAIQQADLTAAVYAGNGRGVGLTLTANVACAWLDQPDACPGCVTGQFFGWVDDDLYALIIAEPDAPAAATCDSSTAHDGVTGLAPDAEAQARPSRRPVRLAAHLPDCPAAPPEPGRTATTRGTVARPGGDSA